MKNRKIGIRIEKRRKNRQRLFLGNKFRQAKNDGAMLKLIEIKGHA